MKKINIIIILLLGVLICRCTEGTAQEAEVSQEAAPEAVQTAPGEENSFWSLWKKQREETRQLREKSLSEKKELLGKQRKEREEAKAKKSKETTEGEVKQKTHQISKTNKALAREQIRERNKVIRGVKKVQKLVAVISSKDDPLYIKGALVRKSKTKFLKLRDVELNYKLKVKNQTPKIINEILIVWERKAPFTERLTIEQEKKVSKPIIPYGERTIEFNELDSGREGETYGVKIARVIFEDGSQWKNPAKKK